MLVIRQFSFSGTNHAKRVRFSGIFNVQVSHELILCTNVQLAPLGIQADNRSKSPSGLVTIQVYADKLRTNRYRSSGRRRQIYGSTGFQCTLVTTRKVVHPTTRKSRKPFRYLISQTQLYRIDVLLAIHVAFQRIGIAWNFLGSQSAYHHSIEHRKTVVKRSLSSATGNTEKAGDRPVTHLISSKQTGDDRRRCLTLIILIQPQTFARSIDIPCLESTLNTQRHMKTVIRQKG